MAPDSPRIVDRITFWLLVSLAALVAITLLLVPDALARPAAELAFPVLTLLLLWPLAAGVILTARAFLLLVRGRRPDLHLFGAVWLRGSAALVVPAVVAAVTIVLREGEFDSIPTYHANLFVSESQDEIRWNDSVASSGGMLAAVGGVAPTDPSWSRTATSLTVDAGDDAFARAFATALAAARLPEGTTVAKVELEARSPWAWLPLYKDVALPFEGTVTVRVARGQYDHVRWAGTFEGELRMTARGFLSAREVGPVMGERLGEVVRERFERKLTEIEEKLGGG